MQIRLAIVSKEQEMFVSMSCPRSKLLTVALMRSRIKFMINFAQCATGNVYMCALSIIHTRMENHDVTPGP